MRPTPIVIAIALFLAACSPAGPGSSSRTSSSSSSSMPTRAPASSPMAAGTPVSSRAAVVAGDWRTFVKPSDMQLKKTLTPEQYDITQNDGTEPPFHNAYWDNHADGIYVDVVSGEPLFSSKEKYDSGTGWPSFWKPLEPGNIVTKTDTLLGYERTEVRSKHADSHLGHVFDDGPQPTGLRYCMDSAALRFIPAADLEREGYGEYAAVFAH